MKNQTIGFVGLGKLGFPCVLAMESKGHRVMGWDKTEEVRANIENRTIPYKEQGMPELLAKTKIKLIPTAELVKQCDIVFVCVQTPHEAAFEGRTRLPFKREEFDYTALCNAVREVNEAAAEHGPTVVSIISTVLPGTVDREIRPWLHENVKLCYNPYTPAMGTAIPDFLHPEFIILGVDDDDAADTVSAFYGTITDAPVRRMSIASAECTKVMYNTFITAKICFTNAIGRMCHSVAGANCDDVMQALQHATKRIVSPAYMNVGMGDSGGCHPRDAIALSAVCRREGWGYDPWGDLMNWRDGYHEWLAWLMIDTGMPLAILGITFKPETVLTTGSSALLVLDSLKRLGHDAMVADPEIHTCVRRMIEFECEPKCFLIGCKHKEFADYRFPKGSVVIDPHRYILEQDGVTVIRIGENGPCYSRR